MPRNRSSSESSDSTSSGGYKSKRSSYKSRRRSTSSSSSSSSSPRSRSRKDRRRDHSSSSSASDSYKKSKKYSKSKKSRSRSPKNIGPKQKTLDIDEERTKNYDFTDGVDDLYKNEKTRQKTLTKLEESGGFQPKSFKSSRSNKKKEDISKFRSDVAHENAIFGTSAESLTRSADTLLNPGILSSSNKSIMSDLFFEDQKTRQEKWKFKMIEILSAK
ncbi:unnamed protein product [Brachionus calyciflorus]|uniref:Uncharacterized protein n=1 Tax=Brachionus calyciflorus TaxID=104777 RepID=A0A814HPW6_9BILA|nr:unnamed protein product [Brachionus calyciflorus]